MSRVLRALLSAVVPGVGQLLAGARARGAAMLSVVLILFAAGLTLTLFGSDLVLTWIVDPLVLVGLLAANLLLLAFRLYAVLDAYRAGGLGSVGPVNQEPDESALVNAPIESRQSRRRGGAGRTLAGAALTFILILTVAPHAVAGYYAYLSYDLVTSVFVSDEPTTPSTTPTSTTPTTIPTSVTTPTSIPTSTPSVTTSSTARTTSTTTPPVTVPSIEAGDDGRLTILVIGTDAGFGRQGARADTIMVATLDLATGRPALLGIPRNTGNIPLTESAADALGTDVYSNLISSLYSDASRHPRLAPEGGDAGAVVLRDSVSAMLGLKIDHYAVVSMGGFVELVDAFGGVTVNVRERLHVRLSPPTPEEEWRVYNIAPGAQHLSGLEALAFARSRTGTDDYDRMRRQRCVISALLYQNGPADIFFGFPDIVKAIRDNLKTDIPIDKIQDLLRIRSDIRTDRLLTVGFTPPEYTRGRNDMGYYILDIEAVQATIHRIYEDPDSLLDSADPAMKLDDSECWKID